MKVDGVRKAIFLGVLGAAVVSGGLASQADDASIVERAINYRKGIMQAMWWQGGYLFAVLDGTAEYDPEKARARAANLQFLSQLPWEGFIAGSETGFDTEAKKAAWDDPEGFKAKQQALIDAIEKLNATAGEGADAARAATADVGAACDGCHDDFRNE